MYRSLIAYSWYTVGCYVWYSEEMKWAGLAVCL